MQLSVSLKIMSLSGVTSGLPYEIKKEFEVFNTTGVCIKTIATHLVFPILFDNEKNIFTSQVRALYCKWLFGKMWKQYIKMTQNYCA